MITAGRRTAAGGDVAPWLVLTAMLAAYTGLFGWLSVTRHDSFGTNALDLGYTTQALWNTAHGRLFSFTTFEGAPYQLDIPIQEVRHPDVLLAYHVEPLLVFIAPLLRIFDDARALLILQTVGLALGAVPAYLLARRRLQRQWLALAFPALFLLAPSIQAANLSDFHTVAFSPAFLLAAYVAMDSGHWKTFGVFCLLALMSREDVALLVAMLGLYAALVYRPRWIGAVTAGFSLLWFGIATGVVMPAFNGLGYSPFLTRYNQFGTSPTEVLHTVVRWPSPLLEWLTRPAVWSYGLLLLGTGGGVVLFGPQGWILALPVIAANALSNYDWMHSGGGHYSANVVAFLIIGAIEGTAWLGQRAGGTGRAFAVFTFLALAVGLATHWWAGISPLARNWNPPVVTAHDEAVRALVDQIPKEAEVIAQSALYPHIATRRRAILFPTRTRADVVVLDVTSTTYPWSMNKYRRAVEDVIAEPGYVVSAAQDGALLLKRGVGDGASLSSPAFTSFAVAETEPDVRWPAEFCDGLALDGYSLRSPMEVTTAQLPVAITTYWRATHPQSEPCRPVLFFTRSDGALVWAYDEGTPTDIWFPTDQWPVGVQMKVAFPPLDLGGFAGTLLGVIPESGDPWTVSDRLPIVRSDVADGVDQETLLPLFDTS